MLNGENNIIHPQLDGTLKGLQIMLQSPPFLTNDGLHSTIDILHAMRKQLLFIFAD